MSRWQTLWKEVPADWYVGSVPSWTTDPLFWSLDIQPPAFFGSTSLNKDMCLWLYNQSTTAKFWIVDPPQQFVFCHGSQLHQSEVRLCVCFRDRIRCCCRNCRRAGSTAWMVEESIPISSVKSRNDTSDLLMLCRNSSIDFLSPPCFPLVMAKS